MRVTAPLSLTALAATGLLLAGCTAPVDTEQPSEPIADGAFTLYSGRDEELVQPLIDQFEAASGIEVEVRYGNTAELGALLLEEGDASPADVFLSQDAGALGALSQAGLFSTLPTDLTEVIPAGFTSTDGSWVGVTGRARVVVFDGERFTADELPDEIDDYVDRELPVVRHRAARARRRRRRGRVGVGARRQQPADLRGQQRHPLGRR